MEKDRQIETHESGGGGGDTREEARERKRGRVYLLFGVSPGQNASVTKQKSYGKNATVVTIGGGSACAREMEIVVDCCKRARDTSSSRVQRYFKAVFLCFFFSV